VDQRLWQAGDWRILQDTTPDPDRPQVAGDAFAHIWKICEPIGGGMRLRLLSSPRGNPQFSSLTSRPDFKDCNPVRHLAFQCCAAVT
jgi:hypothetical protein